MVLCTILSFVMTTVLMYRTFLPTDTYSFFVSMLIGVLSIWAAIAYSVGKNAYGYKGIGDIFVFIFFGIVSVCGSYFLFVQSFSAYILLPGAAIGMLSMAVLNLNNMRDIKSDRMAGKLSIALRMGLENAMKYEMVLLHIPIILLIIFLFRNGFFRGGNYYSFFILLFIIPIGRLGYQIRSVEKPADLDQNLKKVGIITFLISVVMAVCINL
ncbi:1,4-dihydroxy-2-naphthoate octaprenyltransferase [Chryseobacterium sp.]|uniref:1,4-dihydroxy-2-naphthoate octaprenyltransferase n=1 Tax=Chryseobacterium sp. TaxID=1871047 RepID=UPI0025BA26D4|nr:1,4-dihydroxy-2-naphthoate octaprenyltransferase [Chryseobacterium sp.]